MPPRRQLIVTFVALLGACRLAVPGSLSITARELPPDYFPLERGTLWVYEVRHPKGQVELQRVWVKGSRYLTSRGTTGTIVDEAGGGYAELAFDTRWHPVAYYRRGGFLYKFTGLHYESGRELREYVLGDGEEKVLPADPVKVREWDNDLKLFWTGEAGFRLRTRSSARLVASPIHVRAGIYHDCLRVETLATSSSAPDPTGRTDVVFSYVDWYAPGVGLVKSTVTLPAEKRSLTTTELVTFRRGRDGGIRHAELSD